MKNSFFKMILISLFFIIIGCSSDGVTNVKFDRYPSAEGERLSMIMNKRSYDDIFTMKNKEYDFRSTDLSKFNLVDSKDYIRCTFDSQTIWPESLSDEFDIVKRLDEGKRLEVNIQKLHDRGLTGKGIGIAIIDSALLVDHVEIVDSIKMYKEFNIDVTHPIDVHGTEMASIAVGKSIGIAPEADLYYIADTVIGNNGEFDLSNYAKDIERVIEINQDLPDNSKIRVISISVGATNTTKGYDEFQAAIKKARTQNIEVLAIGDANTQMNWYIGMGKLDQSNYDDYHNIQPANYLKDFLYSRESDAYGDFLLVPSDQKTYASITGLENYTYRYTGGMSHVVPYIAGLYALGLQENPEIDFELFTELAKKTALPIKVEKNERQYHIGNMIDSTALFDHIASYK